MAAAHLQATDPFLNAKYRDLFEMMGSVDQCCTRLNRLWHLMQMHSDQMGGANSSSQPMQQSKLLEESRLPPEHHVGTQHSEELPNQRALQQLLRLARGNPGMATTGSAMAGSNAAAQALLPGLLQQGMEGLSEVPEVMEEHLLQELEDEAFNRGAVADNNRFDNFPMQLRQALVESGMTSDNHRYPSLEALSAEMRRRPQGMPRQANRSQQNQRMQSQNPADDLAKAVAANLALLMSNNQFTQPASFNGASPDPPAAQVRSNSRQPQRRTLNQAGPTPIPPDLEGTVMKDLETGISADSGNTGDEALEDADLPSIGSARHQSRQCKPCLFWYQSACHKGKRCLFCHIPHDDGEVRKVRPSKKTRNLLEQHRLKELHQ